jgi:hypothetical protein
MKILSSRPRHHVLGPFFALVALGGCSADPVATDDVERVDSSEGALDRLPSRVDPGDLIIRGEKCGSVTCGLTETCRSFPSPFGPGSPPRSMCVCKDGYDRNASGVCVDIDECSDNPCATNAACVNTRGGYRCDPIPCGERKVACAENATCIYNLKVGSSTPLSRCECNEGFAGDGYACADVDECAQGKCGPFRACTNSIGSYQCGACDAGHALNARQLCVCAEDFGLVPVTSSTPRGTCRQCRATEISQLDPGVDQNACFPLPNHFDGMGISHVTSTLEVREAQGLAHSDTHWFWTSLGTIQRAPRAAGFASPDKGWTLDRLPTELQGKGYDHLGDPDYFNGKLYIPITNNADAGSVVPLVLVLDHELNTIGAGTLKSGGTTDRGGAWVAINPKDGYLYSSTIVGHEIRLKVYDPNNDFRWVQDVPLDFRTGPAITDAWWGGVWTQGAAFSKHGVLYYTLDHGSDNNSAMTGIHVFKVPPAAYPFNSSRATEVIVNNGADNFLHIAYENEVRVPSHFKPVWVWTPFPHWGVEADEWKAYRRDELEGITVTDDTGLGQVHQMMNHNDDVPVIGSPYVNVFHFRVNNTF